MSNQYKWFRLAITDTLFVVGAILIILRRYTFGILLIVIGILYKIKYVRANR